MGTSRLDPAPATSGRIDAAAPKVPMYSTRFARKSAAWRWRQFGFDGDGLVQTTAESSGWLHLGWKHPLSALGVHGRRDRSVETAKPWDPATWTNYCNLK